LKEIHLSLILNHHDLNHLILKIETVSIPLAFEELSRSGLSKTSVENDLRNLVELGLVEKLESDERKVKRSKYL